MIIFRLLCITSLKYMECYTQLGIKPVSQHTHNEGCLDPMNMTKLGPGNTTCRVRNIQKG